MIGILTRAVSFDLVYLFVLTSVDPGDVAVGAVLGLVVALAVRPPATRPPSPAAEPGRPYPSPRAVWRMLVDTTREMIVGSWRVVRFCLDADRAPGFVEIPREGRSRGSVALWGLLTGEAPDEVPVEVDEARGVLIVHLVDADDPDAVRARHHRAYSETLRHVVS